jgi:hypothetical protein
MSKSTKTSFLSAVMLMGLAAGPADASLIGATVTGSFIADCGSGCFSDDLFDPANGKVTSAYLNFTPPVLISNSGIEFGLDDIIDLGGVPTSVNVDEVNFSDSGFVVSDNVKTTEGALPWEIKLTSSAFVGLVLLETFDGFDNSGVFGSLIGDTITLNWAGFPLGGVLGLRSASFSLVPNPVPLPAALPLFAAGLGAMGFMGWCRKRHAA